MRTRRFLPAVFAVLELCAVVDGRGNRHPGTEEEETHVSKDSVSGSFERTENVKPDNVVFEPDSPYKPVTRFDFVDAPSTDSSSLGGENSSLPLILWWTPGLFPHLGESSSPDSPSVIKCGQHRCFSSTNRTLLKDPRTRGIIFYGTDIDSFDLPLPRKRRHEWALLHEESPLNNYMLSHYPFIKLFNHTSTFRRESDYPLSSQYIYSLEYLTERKPVPLEIKNQYRGPPNSHAPVLYVQSHCGVASDRDRYVQELMKYIQVDSYGSCLHNRDLPENLRNPAETFENNDFLDLISKYKFHIAFENAICDDYMTEKLFRCLHLGSVPVYMGSPRAPDWMPDNKSIIMTHDYKSPKYLATYLDFLDRNDEEYLKYLNFKEPGGVTNQFLLNHLREREWKVSQENSMDFITGFECHVCKKLNERMNAKQAHLHNKSIPLLPPKFADNSHMGCPQPYTSFGEPEDVPDGDSWLEMDWIRHYWDDLEKAYAVRNMLQAKEKDPAKFYEYWTQFVEKHERNKA